MRTVGILLALIAACTPVFSETDHDGRTWFNLTAQGRLGPSRWRWYFDVQERNRNSGGDADQFVVRPAIGYSLTENSTVWAGYAYTANFNTTGGVLDENRIFEQYLWSRPAGRGNLSARTRMEQRYFENTEKVTWRLREQVRFVRPLERQPWLAPIVWEEILFHLNSTSRAQHGLDQNRVFAGVGLNVSPKARIEVGYMNQFSHSTGLNRMNHILSTVVSLSF